MNMGMLLLGIWLILHGLSGLIPEFPAQVGLALHVLAVVAGILILVGR